MKSLVCAITAIMVLGIAAAPSTHGQTNTESRDDLAATSGLKMQFHALFAQEQAGASDASNSIEKCTVVAPTTSVQYVNSTITLKILLVEFFDVKHRTSPSAYKASDFTDLLVSSGRYVSPLVYSPDHEQVFGSLNDYYDKMSNGRLRITGSVINRVDSSGVPIWLTLQNRKIDYHKMSYSFMGDAINAAKDEALDVDGLNDSTKLVIIYAGNTYWQLGGLNPQTSNRRTMYITGERQGSPSNQENPGDTFARLGTHAHEFAHLLGIGHSSGTGFDVMQSGYRNGPINTGGPGSAPAPLNPQHRAAKGWIDPIVLPADSQVNLSYSLANPQVYRLNSNYGNDYYLVEFRQFDETMTIGETTVPDYNAWLPARFPHYAINHGVLVWKIVAGDISDYTTNGIISASGRWRSTYPEGTLSDGDDGVPFPGYADVRVLSPWSDLRPPYNYGPLPSNLYVPSTRYGTNVAMEIVSENTDRCTVNLYQTNPLASSPSKPGGVHFSGSMTSLSDHSPALAWSSVRKPDVLSGGNILICRRTSTNGNWEPWALHDSVPGADTLYVDSSILSLGGRSIQYKIQARDMHNRVSTFSDSVTVEMPSSVAAYSQPGAPVEGFKLHDAYPNPFNPSTTISYDIPTASLVTLKVFNILGQEVAILVDEFQRAGTKTVRFDASGLASGLYLIRLQAEKHFETKRTILTK